MRLSAIPSAMSRIVFGNADGLLCDIRLAEITASGVGEKLAVAHDERPVEAESHAALGLHRQGDARVVGRARIAGRDRDEPERDRRDEQDDDERVERPAPDPWGQGAHGERLWCQRAAASPTRSRAVRSPAGIYHCGNLIHHPSGRNGAV
jgi:hypothetical protein